jgi:HPt (histidine-containing phosphotransfer) domain-containing protein
MNQGSQAAQLLDRTAALDRIGGDEELLREIAGLFLSEYPSLIAEIRVAVQIGDARALERSAHSLKGSVANFEACAAVDAAFRLESMGRNGNLDQTASALAALEAAFEALHPALIDLSTQ